jgi:DNA-binding MarR family transcriptional regulator
MEDSMEIDKYAKRSILLAINSCYESVIKSLNNELKEIGCNYMQSLILLSIFFENDGFITPSKTAKALKTSKSNISHAISTLEKNRLIKRTLSPQDSRSYVIRLTSKGERLVTKLMQKIDQYENMFVDLVGQEQSDHTVHFLHAFMSPKSHSQQSQGIH